MNHKMLIAPLLAAFLLSGCNEKKEATSGEPAQVKEENKIASILDEDIVTAPLTEASANRKITTEMTQKEYRRIMNSEPGKKAYTRLMEIFNSNIARIAAGGYNDTFIVTYMNDRNLGIEEAFSGLNTLEQDYVRSKVIHDLEKKGYTVKYNEYWDNPQSINISVSW